jgi:hypothetical protein
LTGGLAPSAAALLILSLAGCGGGGGSTSPTPSNPPPTISSLDPPSRAAGSATFKLTVNGTNFISSSVIRWGGANCTTTRVSATQLTASIPASDIASAGSVSVTVFNPSPGGGSSNAVSFDITNGAPTLTLVTPSMVPAGSPDFMMTLTGTGFVTTSVVRWNGDVRTKTFISATQLEALIPASDVAAVGNAQVTVENPAPGGGTSSPLTFHIVTPPPGNNNTRDTATPISNGTISASISPYGDEDFYSFQATAGATVTIEITARRLPSPSQLDSAIEIQDAAGNRPSTCRSPDRPFDFNTFSENDPTPTAFDDECVNDDIQTVVEQDSRLEFRPSTNGTYYIHVVDLRGDGRPDLIYELSLSGAN